MKKIVDALYDHFIERNDIFIEYNKNIEINNYPYCYNILLYFFGIDLDTTLVINEQDNINILYNIYKELIIFHNCSSELLYKCFKFNRLDELIKQKNSHRKSFYYQNLEKKNIIIGKTNNDDMNYDNFGNLLDDDNNIVINNFEILDGDHCPNCKTEGYISKNFGKVDFVPDCAKCYVPLCAKCANKDPNFEPYSRICFNCIEFKSTGNLKQNIINKISSHKQTDIKKFNKEGNITNEFINEQINNQNKKCYICEEEVLLENWKPYCCYQFSIDRIDNNYPHNKDNIKISCYYCNCRHYPKFTQHYKICSQGCHTTKKHILKKKEILE